MSVDQKSINDMARLMKAMGDNRETSYEMVMTPEEKAAAASKATVTGDPNIDAMKKILEAFHSVTDDIAMDSTDNKFLAEALVTEKTPTGARIGSWDIVVHEGESKRYDVVSAKTGETIADNLYLYDAAYGLVKRLNEGVKINDKRIRDLLVLEDEYARRLDEVNQYKKRARKLNEQGDVNKAAIAEDRQDDASRRADDAHSRLLELAGIKI